MEKGVLDGERRVALGEVELEPGTVLLFGEDDIRLEIVNVVGNPTIPWGDRGGYIELSDGTFANLMGETPSDPDPDVEKALKGETIRELKDADSVMEAYPEPTGSRDVDDWKVDWVDIEYPNNGGTWRLTERQQEIVKRELVEATSEDGVRTLLKAIRGINTASETVGAAMMDKFFTEMGEGGGVRDVDGDVPTLTHDDMVTFGVYIDASSKLLRENMGKRFELHRGLGFHAVEPMLHEIFKQYERGGLGREVTLWDNTASIWTTDRRYARSFSKGVVVSKEFDYTHTLSASDQLLNHGAGFTTTKSEGQVDVPGHKIPISTDKIFVGDTNVTFKDFFDDPVGEALESQYGVADRVAQSIKNYGWESVATRLLWHITGDPRYPDNSDQFARAVSKLLEMSGSSVRDSIETEMDIEIQIEESL